MCAHKGELIINLDTPGIKVPLFFLEPDSISCIEQFYSSGVRMAREEITIMPLHWTEETAQKLVRLFSSVNRLTLRCVEQTNSRNCAEIYLEKLKAQELHMLLSVLDQEWTHLRSLSILKMKSFIIDPDFVPHVCEAINRLHRYQQIQQSLHSISSFGLSHLELKFPWFASSIFDTTIHPVTYLCSDLLSQLSRFNVFCGTQTKPELLLRFNHPASKLTELEMSSPYLNYWNNNSLAPVNIVPRCNLTRLIISQISSNQEFIEPILPLYTSLRSLQLCFVWCDVMKLDHSWFRILGQLKELSELRLHRFTLDHFCSSNLPSIRKLTLCTANLFSKFNSNLSSQNNRFSSKQFMQTSSSQFPFLQTLVIAANDPKAKPTVRALKNAAFKQCSHLQKACIFLRCKELKFRFL